MKDLLSGDFTETVNRVLLKKLQVLSRTVLSLCLVYSGLEIINWGIAIKNSINTLPDTFTAFYTYRLLPVIFLVIMLISILGHVFNVKAASLLVEAFEHKDADILNKGFSFLYKTATLTIVSFCIAIISVTIRIFTYY